MWIDDAQAQQAAAMNRRSEQNSPGLIDGVEINTAASGRTKAEMSLTIEAVIHSDNLRLAYQRVVENKGAAGVDNLSVSELKPWLIQHLPTIKSSLTAGSYLPRAIRKVDTPKPNGDVRTPGIPTVAERLIQQAIAQALTPYVEPMFSNSSYGFRPNRNAWQAVRQAQQFIQSGKRWVVDMDLEKFFDRVDHDILMSRLARTIKDERLLKLIRRYLEAEMVDGKEVIKRDKGMPQGGPLSPLLSNILLDELDKELERRGHRFCRYADDCNIYVSSQKAGEHLLKDISEFLKTTLKLQVKECSGKATGTQVPWLQLHMAQSGPTENSTRQHRQTER